MHQNDCQIIQAYNKGGNLRKIFLTHFLHFVHQSDRLNGATSAKDVSTYTRHMTINICGVVSGVVRSSAVLFYQILEMLKEGFTMIGENASIKRV